MSVAKGTLFIKLIGFCCSIVDMFLAVSSWHRRTLLEVRRNTRKSSRHLPGHRRPPPRSRNSSSIKRVKPSGKPPSSLSSEEPTSSIWFVTSLKVCLWNLWRQNSCVYHSWSLQGYCLTTLSQAGIPLKTKTNHSGAYTEAELFDILGDIYSCVLTKSFIPYCL